MENLKKIQIPFIKVDSSLISYSLVSLTISSLDGLKSSYPLTLPKN